MSSLHKAYLFAATATLLWSTAAAAFKITLGCLDGNVVRMLFWSTTFSLAVLGIILTLQRKIHHLKKVGWVDLKGSALLGLLNPFLYYLVLFRAYDLLPGQEAQPLNFTWPIVLTLLSVPFLKQKLRPVHILAVVVSFIGVIVISTHGRVLSMRFSHPTGAMMALGTSVMWASYWILNRRDARDTVVKLFTNFGFGFVYIAVLAAATGNLSVPLPTGFLGTAWIGFFEMGITFVLWLKALEASPRTSMVTNIVYLCPFLALLFLRMLVGEKILPSSVTGLCLIVAGILIQARQKSG